MNNIQITYLILAIIWILIVIFLRLWKTNIIGWMIILFPLIIFGINVYYSNDVSSDNPNANVSSDNTLSIGILLLIPLIAYCDRNVYHTQEYRNRFIAIAVTAIVLFLLSYVVIWTPRQYVAIVNRVITSFTTMSVALTIFLLYLYYTHRSTRKIEIPEEIYKQYDSVSLNY
jgi:hypothetical protein